MGRMSVLAVTMLCLPWTVPSFAASSKLDGDNRSTKRVETSDTTVWRSAQSGSPTANDRLNELNRRLESHRQRVKERQWQKEWREREKRIRNQNTYQKDDQTQQKYQTKKERHKWQRETAGLKLELMDPPQDSVAETGVTGDGLKPLKTYIEPVEPPSK
jgi:predicted  nucleic acid-binding Zn-ribbon protein